MTTSLWVIQATAVASEGCEYPRGETHAVLVFATAPDRDGAFSRMQQGLTAHGWGEAEVTRSGTISSDTGAIQDEGLRAAAASAIESGCCVVADPEPIRPDPGRGSN